MSVSLWCLYPYSCSYPYQCPCSSNIGDYVCTYLKMSVSHIYIVSLSVSVSVFVQHRKNICIGYPQPVLTLYSFVPSVNLATTHGSHEGHTMFYSFPYLGCLISSNHFKNLYLPEYWSPTSVFWKYILINTEITQYGHVVSRGYFLTITESYVIEGNVCCVCSSCIPFSWYLGELSTSCCYEFIITFFHPQLIISDSALIAISYETLRIEYPK